MDELPWKLFETYIKSYPNYLVKHHLDPYNDFWLKQLPEYYAEAFDVAQACYRGGDYTKDMNYKNFDYLDDNFNKKYDLELMYFKLKEIYNMNIGKL